MDFRLLVLRLLSVLLPLAFSTSLYLYIYPVFHGCSFALPKSNQPSKSSSISLFDAFHQHINSRFSAHPDIAPFRLLILADPQLEGDTSLPSPDDGLLPRLRDHWIAIESAVKVAQSPFGAYVLSNISAAARLFVREDLPCTLRGVQKRLDLFGNDFYLAHIYRTLRWWTVPTHVAVLGDLIGSQWASDEEFERRSTRFWNRVFKGGMRVDDRVTATGGPEYKNAERGAEESVMMGSDSTWAQRIINIAGNHDIGYAGDVSAARIERFERLFGRTNWDVRFEYPHNSPGVVPPTLHLINLNSLTLDSPPFDADIQRNSFAYINDLIFQRSRPVEDRTSFTLLLTHVPLHKRDGICTDGPHIVYHEFDDEDAPDNVPRFREGGLQEQHHLSEHVSANGVLEGIFGMSGNEGTPGRGLGRNGLILTGHDHTGCDVIHFVNRSTAGDNSGNGDALWKWDATRYKTNFTVRGESPTPFIREVTLRSMMGEFGGNAGLLSLWFDSDPAVNEWRYEISMCKAGVQHIWWAIHVLDVLTVGLVGAYVISRSHTKQPAAHETGELPKAPKLKI